MKRFDDFQKQVIRTLAKIEAPAEIDLSKILARFIPDDLFIGITNSDEPLDKAFIIHYKANNVEYVQGILSVRISSFIQLIEELIRYDYIIKVPKTAPFKELAIGNYISDNENYGRYRIGSNLSYAKLREFLILSDYYTTKNLTKLPEFDFSELNDYVSTKNLKYTHTLVIVAIIAVTADILLGIISLIINN